ncbi:MAG: tetratricopeptide repeat protein, partial [Myxococcales bacterium]|nr:tetratricopeptide repeat protein [Myxococcales bacterium]
MKPLGGQRFGFFGARRGAVVAALIALAPLVVGRVAHSQPVPLALPELTFSGEDRFKLADILTLDLPRALATAEKPSAPFRLAMLEARRIAGYGPTEAPFPTVGCMNAVGFTSWFARGLGSVENTYERAVYLLEDKEPDDAEGLFREVIADKPDGALAADSRFWLGEILASRGNLEGALEHYLNAGRAPTPGALRDYADYNAGWAAFELKRFDVAHERFAEVAGRGTSRELASAARFWDGLSLAESGEWKDAAAQLRTFSAERTVAGHYADEARYLTPVAEFQAGEYGAAAGHFTALARGPVREDLAPLALLGEGFSRIRAGSPAPGLESLDAFLEKYPTHAQADAALLGTVVAASTLGRSDEMRQRFDRMRERFPQSPHLDAAYFEVGGHYFGKGEYERARAVLAEMIQRFPLSKIIDLGYALLAESYMAMGSYTQAAVLFAQSQTRTQDPALKDLRRHREAIARLYDGETGAALAIWRDLVARERAGDPPASELHAWMGEALIRDGQWKLAHDAFAAVDPAAPRYPRAVYQLGYCAFQMGEWADAQAS